MMDLKKILAISGYPGLFMHLTEGRSGIIVESLTDKKRMNAPASLRISTLDDIAVFTEKDEVKLEEIFEKIHKHENGGTSIDPKSDKSKLIEYFAGILPDYDRDRVYVSDMKKIISWYNILHAEKMLDFSKKVKGPKEKEKSESDPDDQKSKPKTATKKTSQAKKGPAQGGTQKVAVKKSPAKKSTATRKAPK